MSARFTGTPSLLPRHVCQIHRHYKLVTPACLPDSRALQACHPLLSGRFAGTSSLSPAQNCPFSGHSEAIPPPKPPVSRSFSAISALFRAFGTCDARFDAAGPERAHGGACSLRDPARDPLPGRVTSGTLALLQTAVWRRRLHGPIPRRRRSGALPVPLRAIRAIRGSKAWPLRRSGQPLSALPSSTSPAAAWSYTDRILAGYLPYESLRGTGGLNS